MPTPDRSRAHAIVRARGWNGTSFQVLGDGFSYHFDEDAFVAYVDTGTAWVAAGAPVVSRDRLAAVAESFCAAAAEAGRSVCFFGVGSRFVAEVPAWRALTLGAQPVWRTSRWRERAERARSIGGQVRRAAAHGVAIRRIDARELEEGATTRRAVEAVLARWLSRRRMAPMGFLVGGQPFAFADERRMFVAEHGGRIVAVSSAAPIYARRGWLVETLARLDDAPNGTTEALVDATIRAAGDDGDELVTLGMSPLSGVPVARPLRIARWLTSPFYDFTGLHAFRAKLRPDEWEPLYISVPPGGGRWRGLLESLRAFAGGGVVSFALRSAWHLAQR